MDTIRILFVQPTVQVPCKSYKELKKFRFVGETEIYCEIKDDIFCDSYFSIRASCISSDDLVAWLKVFGIWVTNEVSLECSGYTGFTTDPLVMGNSEVYRGPERVHVLEMYMSLGEKEIRTSSYFIFLSKTIAITGVLYCFGPEGLGTWVIDITEHCDVCLGNYVAHRAFGDTMGMFITCWRCFYSVSKWVTKFCKFIGLVSSLHIDFYSAIYSGAIRLPFWVSMEKHCHSVLEFSNEFCLCEHRVHFVPGSEVCKEVGVYKTVGPNTVMCKSIDNKLLSWIVRNIRQYIMLVRRVLMCTS